MNFLIADTFTASFNRLSGVDQKAVKASVFDLQMDPTGNGLQLHRIDKSKDPNFWSARVNRDVRLIVHKTGDSLLVAYVGHHDDAYAWAERRRIEAHPRTGAIQIVEVRERVEDVAPPATFDFVFPEPAKGKENETAAPALFSSLDDDALLSIGVPADWLADVRAANEDGFFALAAHLPAEASEALLEFAATGRLVVPAPPSACRSLHASRCAAADSADRRPGGTGTGAGLSVGEMGRLPPPVATGAGRAFLLGAGARGGFGGNRQDHRCDPSRGPARPRESERKNTAGEFFAAAGRRHGEEDCWSLRPRPAASSPGSPPRRSGASPSRCTSSNTACARASPPTPCCASGCAPPPPRPASRAFRSASCCPSGPTSSTPGACRRSTPIRPSSEWAARAGSAPISAHACGRCSRRCGGAGDGTLHDMGECFHRPGERP